MLTAEGFRPTELNPRYSGGLTVMGRLMEGDLLALLQMNLATGRDPGVGAADLEAWALACSTSGAAPWPRHPRSGPGSRSRPGSRSPGTGTS